MDLLFFIIFIHDIKKWGISPKFVKRKKRMLIDPRQETYAKSPKMMISPSPYSLLKDIFSTVDIELGGVRLEGVLIDSSSTCNVIDRTTWETLKEKKVKYVSRKSNRKLYSY